jgi:serine protease Do
LTKTRASYHRSFLFVAGLLLVTAATAQDSKSTTLRDELREMIGGARDRVYPALVSIRVVTVRYHGGRELKGQAVGSGSIISDSGHVLTNEHVVRNGRVFICTLSDKREVSARLLGEDPLTDLALLALDMDELAAGEPLPVAVLGDSDALEVGDYVMAMGSPFSLSRSVSLGIVSNTERVFAAGFGSDDVREMELESGQRTGLFTRWIQHDALLNPGNSGGPLVNLRGEVVGVNELGGNAMGFAIPSNLALRVAAALAEHGEVLRSWIGISFKPIQRTGFDDGVLINSVESDAPAQRAGIQAGDVLLAMAGEEVTVRFPEEVPPLLDRIASLPVGSPLVLTVLRDGERLTVTPTTEKLQADVGDEVALSAWGLTAREITEKMARDRGLESRRGVLLSGSRQGGPAQTAEPALRRGDVLTAIGDHQIDDLKSLLSTYETSLDEEPPVLLIHFRRRGTDQLALLEPRADDEDNPPRELPKAWIGVATQPVLPRLASQLGLDEVRGFRVTRVYPESVAASSGLAVGDIVVALDAEPLSPRGVQDSELLNRHVRRRSIGDTVRLSVLRQGVTMEIEVVLERTRLTSEEARRHRDSDFELAVRELTFFDRDENRWDAEMAGVLVENVDAGGWAGLGGIRPFDVLLEIAGTEIRSLKSFRRVLRQIKEEKAERVVVVVLRGRRTAFQYLEPEWVPSRSH